MLVVSGAFATDSAEVRSADPDDIYWRDITPSGIDVVYGTMVYDGRLVIGGSFDYIYAWDEANWAVLGLPLTGGSFGPPVLAMTVYGGNLVVASNFDSAGGVAAKNIALWDGSSWSPLGSGVDTTSEGNSAYVFALTVYDGKLYAGGYFSTAGGIVANNIAVWDGVHWSPLGTGTDKDGSQPGMVEALTVYNGKLVVGGRFKVAGGITANYVAMWDGESWAPLGSGTAIGGLGFLRVMSLTVYDGKLIVGGEFSTVEGATVNNIVSWNGSTWSGLGSGMSSLFGGPSSVKALATYDGKLIAGGDFSKAGGVTVNGLASWDGVNWSRLGAALSGSVNAFTEFNGKLVVGGAFTMAGGSSDKYLAQWSKGYCVGISGNVDCDSAEGCDISDLSALIDHLYISLSPLCFPREANVDGSLDRNVDISDLSALIDYLYISFTPPAACL